MGSCRVQIKVPAGKKTKKTKRAGTFIRTAQIWTNHHDYLAPLKPTLLLKIWFSGDISVNFGPILKI